MNRFMNLDIWNLAMDLVVDVYKTTNVLPKQELNGLQGRSRKSSVAIPSHIAQGAERNDDGEFNAYLGHAAGSAAELITQLMLAKRLRFITSAECDILIDRADHIMKGIFKLQAKLKPNGTGTGAKGTTRKKKLS